MTTIKPDRPIRRETASLTRRRPIIIELHPGYLTLKAKRGKTSVAVDYAAILDLGYKMLARAERAEKAKKGGRR